MWSLELEIGTLSWGEMQTDIYFTLTKNEKCTSLNERVHGTCQSLVKDRTRIIISSQCPWIGGGFTPLEFEYVVRGSSQHRVCNVNVYWSTSELAAAMTEACGGSTD